MPFQLRLLPVCITTDQSSKEGVGRVQVALVVIETKHNVSDMTGLVWGKNMGNSTAIVQDHDGQGLLLVDQGILINSSLGG